MVAVDEAADGVTTRGAGGDRRNSFSDDRSRSAQPQHHSLAPSC
jgi:hypothetical protein